MKEKHGIYFIHGKRVDNATEFVKMQQALYIAFENGIFKSEDSGKTWKVNSR